MLGWQSAESWSQVREFLTVCVRASVEPTSHHSPQMGSISAPTVSLSTRGLVCLVNQTLQPKAGGQEAERGRDPFKIMPFPSKSVRAGFQLLEGQGSQGCMGRQAGMWSQGLCAWEINTAPCPPWEHTPASPSHPDSPGTEAFPDVGLSGLKLGH